MNTYEFMVTVAGSDFKAYAQSNNPSYAYQKCRRLYPTASEIKFIRLVKNENINKIPAEGRINISSLCAAD